MSDDLIRDRAAWRDAWEDDYERLANRVAGAMQRPGVDAVVRVVLDETQSARAAAWDEGHLTRWRRGPDNCQCGAWNSGECGCGEYGTGELLSLATNPYRTGGAA